MKITLTLPDECWETYQRYTAAAPSPRGTPAADSPPPSDAAVAELLSHTLAFWSDVDPQDRVVVLRGPVRQALERLLGGAVLSQEDLLAKVEELAKISIGEVRMELRPEQIAQLKRHAEKRGITYLEALEQGVRYVEAMVAWAG